MRRSTSKRLAGRWLAALLALATVGVVSSSNVRAAGCATGHAPRRSPATYRALLEMLDAGGALPEPQGPAPGDRPRPCTGAFCSGLPATPFSAVPEVSPGFDQWAIATSLVLLLDSGTMIRPHGEAEFQAVHQADPIFHPPRRPAATVTV
ncbi:hypothetical protein [Paludisphaera borealis]|uniref:Uncharacterized protein n=1 Tax=Paludisphaera borealis TaxID=1387353 RepID=A0A1U7CTA9_9BACT|nr:hypothetical protein [Paludisphaera borealis]APW62113.1 hypothetical protein BSF38_03645 [Paludisphaera borealis]